MGLAVWDALRGAYESVPGAHSSTLKGHAVAKDGTLVATNFVSNAHALRNLADLASAAVARNGRGMTYLYARPRTKPGRRPRSPSAKRIDDLSAHERLDMLARYDVPCALHRFVIEA